MHPHSLFLLPRSYGSHTNSEMTEALFLLISLPILKAVQTAVVWWTSRKANLMTKILRNINWTEIPPHQIPNEASVCPLHCLNQEKMVQHFAFYPLLLSTSHLFFLPNIMANNFNLWKARYILAVAICLVRTKGGTKSFSYCKYHSSIFTASLTSYLQGQHSFTK